MRKEGFIIPLLIATMAVLGIGGYLTYTKHPNPFGKLFGWKTYNSKEFGFKFKYPENWQIKENFPKSVNVINPEYPGKPDTDIPVEAISFGPVDESCEPRDWNIGFGLVYYKTICFENNKRTIRSDMTAWDSAGQEIENKIFSTFQFVEFIPPEKTVIKTEQTPFIESIIPSTAFLGSTLEIKGSGFNGFEGDVNFYFERLDGKSVILPGVISIQPDGTQKVSLVLKQPCLLGETVYGTYSGIASICDYVELSPGTYKVFTKPFGEISNIVTFEITNQNTSSDTSDWQTYVAEKGKFSIKVPKDFKTFPETNSFGGATPTQPDLWGSSFVIPKSDVEMTDEDRRIGNRTWTHVSIQSWTELSPEGKEDLYGDRNYSFQDWIDFRIGPYKEVFGKNLLQESVVVDGYSARKFSYYNGNTKEIGVIVYIETPQRMYEIESFTDIDWEKEYGIFFDSMLSSMKFII